MNWEAVGAIGETVGAVAVCVTLIFLVRQIRQSNSSQKTAAYQTYLVARTDMLKSTLQPEVNEALIAGSFRPFEASADELQRYHQIMHLSLTFFASAHRLWSDGLLSDDEWEANLSMLTEFKGTAGFRIWWPSVSNFYNDDFVAEIDRAPMQSAGLERFLEQVANQKGDQK